MFSIFLNYTSGEALKSNIREFNNNRLVSNIFVFMPEQPKKIPANEGKIIFIRSHSFLSTHNFNLINKLCKTDYFGISLTDINLLQLGQNTLHRFLQIGEYSGSGLIYSDYTEIKNGKRIFCPTIEYQSGSVRNDFNFGHFIVINKEALKYALINSVAGLKTNFTYAGFYQIRLGISRKYLITRIPESLYTISRNNLNESGENHFRYVDPKNRAAEAEMEKVFSDHLKKIKANLQPVKKPLKFDKNFKVEASVVIPVLNRAKTIGTAIESVLKQKCNFDFNLIIVNNHSTDETTEVIKSISEKDKRIIHIIPEKTDLLIGGCWNEAVFNRNCGKFAVQLDSDDLFPDEDSLQKIINKFYEEKCAMVIGTYKITDLNFNEIPPGIVDHKEWTAKNGLNNALRINGLGAPRAYYTPVIRKIQFPNVSYGEDYAAVLAISRDFKIARIFEPIYICRRWEGNSDSFLSTEKENSNNFYKDKLRTFEIQIRKKIKTARK